MRIDVPEGEDPKALSAQYWALAPSLEETPWIVQLKKRWSKLGVALRTIFGRLSKSAKTVEQGATPQLSAGVETVLFCVTPVRRNDVLNDLSEWYPVWVQRVGLRKAKFIVWVRVADTLFHSVLDYAERVAGIIGKMKGAK